MTDHGLKPATGLRRLDAGRKYQPDALLITVYANDVTNTFAYLKKEWLYDDMSSDDKETRKKARLERYFPHLLTLLFMTSMKTSLPAERTPVNFAMNNSCNLAANDAARTRRRSCH